jgi:trimethylamine--corrinoid protein Co-methyltransferase
LKVRKGLSGGQYQPLSDGDIEQLHHTILKVFAEIGVQVNFPEARQLFRKAGATVDDDSRIVKIPAELFQELIGRAPSTVTLYGRGDDGELDCEIGGDKVYIGTGGTALNVQDPGENGARRSQLNDIMRIARLV